MPRHKKFKLKAHIPNFRLGYTIKENLKWTLGLIVFIIIAILLTVPAYIWMDLTWLTYIPPIILFWQLIVPILALIVVASFLRFIYVVYKGNTL